MLRTTAPFLGLIVVGAVAGTTLGFAPLYLAIPIGLVGIAVIAVRNRARPETTQVEAETERNRLGARRLDFTERDRRTLYPRAAPSSPAPTQG